jgi:uncharacterized protein (DUF4415 family)
MKKECDFSQGQRGAVVRAPQGKTRMTLRLDDDILARFREEVENAGGGSYQGMMNRGVRESVQNQREPLEKILRRVIREELQHA